MKGLYTVLLLIVSNIFMTFAWYGHLKMKQEYSWFATLPFKGESLHWNHLAAFVCLILAVYFVFMK